METILGLQVPTAAHIGRCMMILGFVFGVLTAAASLFSAYLLDRVSTEVQADADQQIAKANFATEQLHNKNLELEKAVSPRSLEQYATAQELRPFANVSFVVVAPNDFEMDRTAGRIRFMLESADWKKYLGPVNVHQPFRDGVLVRTWIPPDGYLADTAGDALIAILRREGIAATRGAPIKELGPDVVYIEVGPKPLPEALEPERGHTPGIQFRGGYSPPWK
jgi:hypothetical protein